MFLCHLSVSPVPNLWKMLQLTPSFSCFYFGSKLRVIYSMNCFDGLSQMTRRRLLHSGVSIKYLATFFCPLAELTWVQLKDNTWPFLVFILDWNLRPVRPVLDWKKSLFHKIDFWTWFFVNCELDFLSIASLIFAGYTGSKNPVRTRQKIQFIKLDFTKIECK